MQGGECLSFQGGTKREGEVHGLYNRANICETDDALDGINFLFE